MTVVFESEKIEKHGKMFCPSNTGYHSRSDKQQQRWCEESQSRVSFPPENGFPSESPLCRTMRPAVPVGHHYSYYKSENNRSSGRLSTRKCSKHSTSSSYFSSSSSHSPSLSSTDSMCVRSIQTSIGILSGSKFARLLSSGEESCSHSHYYAKLASPSPSQSSVPSSSAQKSYHHQSSHMPHHHHWASFGMILIAVIILSTFSTSSMVMCVPLGGTGGVEEARRTAGGAGLMMAMSPSKMVDFHRKLQNNNNNDEEQQSQGEIHLPSLLTHGGGGVADQTVEHSNLHRNINNPSNYHQLLQKQNQPPIQKLHKDFPRSIMENAGDDEEDDNNIPDSDELGNQVDTMVAPPVSSSLSSTSSLTGLGRLSLGGSGNGVGGDDDPSSSDQLDQSSAGQWETVIDPHLYVLTEWNRGPYQRGQQEQQQYSMFRQQRKRRNSGSGASLSIVNPLDVLRQRLLLEIARRRMRQSHHQIIQNEEILRKIGRR